MNDLLKIRYKMESGPKPMPQEDYKDRVCAEFEDLLSDFPSDESKFQDLFEKNPSLLMGNNNGAFYGKLGTLPFLVTQPNLNGIINRKPDFLFLLEDSINFTPLFIEIESPLKKMFIQNGKISAQFGEAYNQLKQWKSILSTAQGAVNFFNDFSIPDKLQNKYFKPNYLLIYGRRKEYQNDRVLTRIRGQYEGENIHIISYDRLLENISISNYLITCKVKNGKYIAKYVSPTIELGPRIQAPLKLIDNFNDAVDNSVYISGERKAFLKTRNQYWCGLENISLFYTSDVE